MEELQELLRSSTERAFAAQDPADPALWARLEAIGLTRASAPESGGGSGLPLTDSLPLLRIAGAHAVAQPLAETLLAHWLAGQAGIALPDGAIALAPSRPGEAAALRLDGNTRRLDGQITRVASSPLLGAALLVTQDGGRTRLHRVDQPLSADALDPQEGSNLAGEPRPTWRLAQMPVSATAPAPMNAGQILALGAIARSLLIAGACARVLELCVEYANLREQFGRPIARFQAVQQNLANLAAQAAAASAASEIGLAALAGDGIDVRGAAMAKLRAASAATTVAAIAHQTFGAIGFTEEHALHRYTRRLWSWSEEWGGQRHWARELGRALASEPDGLWPALTRCPLTYARS